MWKNSRRSVLLSVVLFCLFSAWSWGAECSEGWDHAEREAEDQELEIILTTLDETIKAQKTKINALENSQARSGATINEQAISLKEAERSWQAEKKATTFKVIAGGGIGFLVGWFIYWLLDNLGRPGLS